MMHLTPLELLCAVSTAFVVSVAIITDLRSRRIPNALTFPALGVALVIRFAFQEWNGLGLALAGAVIAPVVLSLIHLGRGIGMGDLKLAAAVGAFLGPTLAVIAMLFTAILGGVLAIALQMRRGQLLSELFSLFMIGIPFWDRKAADQPANTSSAAATMPYGVAIGVGSLATLAGYAWLGTALPSFVGIAARL